jgi:DNA helicase II / ATP-dependent DNA helicase PcrA
MSQEQVILDETIDKIKNQTYYVWELLERKKSQFKQGTSYTGDEIVYKRGVMDKDLLRKAEREPYFGSFEIYSDEDGTEKFYIGKQGVRDRNENLIVVDWRMPIASVYYNFTPGKSKQSYSFMDERARIKHQHTVDVLNKREITIKDQKIKKIIQQVSELTSNSNVTISESGEELTITDEFLREIIENSETTGYLKEIIATIQQEQDKAIRQSIDRNVIIQGVAGSGKSSIALHRLSYLLYNNKHIKTEEVLILGPSNLFISSVKDLLPELNLEGIQQFTIQNLLLKFLKPVLHDEIHSGINQYFEEILFKNQNEEIKKIIEFKGSESFGILLDIFISKIKDQYENRISPITLFTEQLNRDSLVEIFNGYKYLSFAKRVERFQQHVENHFKRITEEKVKEIENQYEFVVETFLKNGGLDKQEYLKLENEMHKVSGYKKNKARDEFKEILSSWKETMKFPDVMEIYKQVLSFEILKAFENETGTAIPLIFKDHKLEKLTYFDLAPLFYIYLLLYDKPAYFSHIVIDEAQDLSFLHFAALKKMTKTMTLLGDKDQSIFMEYGQYSWNELKDSLFQSGQDMILTLDTSYRSTKEIIEVANRVLYNQKGNFHKPIIPLNRSGKKVEFAQVRSGKDLLDNIVQTLKNWKKHYKRIAIIHKDEKKARKLAQYLSQEYNRDVVYISPEQELVNNSISVLASYYCKGMEFDAVILANISEESFPKDQLHARLLYVMLTRAQQEMKVFYQEKPSVLLDGLVETISESSSVFDDIL